MKIQFATELDIPKIQEIALAAWYPTYGKILTPEQSEYMLEMMYSDNALKKQFNEQQLFALLFEEKNPDTPLGFVSMEFGYKNNTTVKIHKLYLLPAFKGKGLGKQLIALVEKEAAAHGSTCISLNMNKYNSSYGFYKHLGFLKVKEENIDIGDGYIMEDFVLEKSLL